MSLSLSYGIPPAQYQATYGNRVLFTPNEGSITTQLPKNMALTRIVHIIALSIFVAVSLKTTIFCWPVVVLGAAFAAWTGYKHLLTKDPLVEVFYRIVGGQENFEKLPQIQLEQNQPIGTAVNHLIWADLPSISRATAEDGRKIVIVKGLSHQNGNKPSLLFSGNCRTQKIFVFVEKLSPFDYPNRNAPQWFNYIAFIGYAHPFFSSHRFNIHGSSRGSCEGVEYCHKTSIKTSITASLANEFFVQLNPQ